MEPIPPEVMEQIKLQKAQEERMAMEHDMILA